MPWYSGLPKHILAINYEVAAQTYLRSLPPEHFMESIAQARQRAITLASFALVQARRKDVQVFNELLVQYPRRQRHRLGQVVPDNMIVLCDQPVQATGSFNLPLESAGPFWVFEYVSKTDPRKDYKETFDKYERDLKVPYYLIFYPDTQDLTLYRHNGRKYVTVKPNREGRYAVPELEMEVALLDGWVRFWYQGELLPLPEELERELDGARQQAELEKRRADDEKRRADDEKRRADDEKRRADDEKRRADDEKRRADTLADRLRALEQELAQARPRNRK
jgi:Uma2 family endonuclease